MKNIKILSAIVLIFTLVSCDDFLDIKPVGKVIPTTYQDYRDLMTYAYDNVPSNRSLASVRGDELLLVKDFYNSYLSYKGIFLWEDTKHDPSTKVYPWQEFYKVILNANQVIEAPDDMEGVSASEVNQLKGEAYLMRAYMHYGLSGLYSDVYSSENASSLSIPLAVKIDIWQNYKRNTIGEVYNQIISDIDKAISLLNVNEQEKGLNYRFSKVSAYGFAARVYLSMEDWQKAAEYAKKAYSINNKLEDLNNPEAKLPTDFTSVENILAMEQTYKGELKWLFVASDKLINAYDKENDLRFNKYFKSSGADYKPILGIKDQNKVSMRTAEFYLILAEAEAKQGNLSSAKDYLKKLLNNRLTATLFEQESADIDKMDESNFLEKLKVERFKELACQGFRWFDLKRYGKSGITKIFDGTTYELKKGDARYIIPFPKEAIDNNPNLVN